MIVTDIKIRALSSRNEKISIITAATQQGTSNYCIPGNPQIYLFLDTARHIKCEIWGRACIINNGRHFPEESTAYQVCGKRASKVEKFS